MSQPRPLIHVGIMKTAQTFLEKAVYSQSPEIYLFGTDMHAFGTREEQRAALSNLAFADEPLYDDTVMKNHLQQAKAEAEAAGQQLLWMSDTLTAGPMHYQTAQRLKDLLPDARILLTIRHQHGAIQSWYGYRTCGLDAPAPYTHKYVEINDWLRYAMPMEKEVYSTGDSYLSRIDYFAVAEAFAKVFGRENVTVLPMEDINQDPDNTVKVLTDLMPGLNPETVKGQLTTSKPANVRVSENALKYRRFRQYFFPNTNLSELVPFKKQVRAVMQKLLSGGGKAKADIEPTVLQDIDARYAPGNQKLQELYGLDLAKRGYPLP